MVRGGWNALAGLQHVTRDNIVTRDTLHVTRVASPEPEYERDAHVSGGDGGHVVQHLAATCQDHLARPLVTHLPCR